MSNAESLRQRVRKCRDAVSVFSKLERQIKGLRRGIMREVAPDQLAAMEALSGASLEVLNQRLQAAEAELQQAEPAEQKSPLSPVVTFPAGLPLQPPRPAEVIAWSMRRKEQA
jgi:hypothetical protein